MKLGNTSKLSHSLQTEIALALANKVGSIPTVKEDPEPYRLEFEEGLRSCLGDYDFDADSLQKRLLAYMEKHCGLRRVKENLSRAEKSRRRVLETVNRQALLGLHNKNKGVQHLVECCSDLEKFLLNKVVISENVSKKMQDPAIANVIFSKIKEGHGEAIMSYLVSRRRAHQSRMKKLSREGGETVEVVNKELFAAAALWTNPKCPLWLLPSAASAALLHDKILPERQKLTPEAFSNMVAKAQLVRAPEEAFRKLVSARNTAGKQLLKEVEEATGSSFRTGRPCKTQKK